MKLPDDTQRLGLVFKKTDHLKLSVDNEGKEDVWGKCVSALLTKGSNCTAYILGASTHSTVTWPEKLLGDRPREAV